MAERRLKPVTEASNVRARPFAQLSGRAAEIHDELAPTLELTGRLTPETAPMFALLCQAIAVAENAGTGLEGVDRPGTRRGRPQRVRDPRWLGFRDATALCLKLATAFGLTPSSAASLKIARRPTLRFGGCCLDEAERRT